ncbi:unnamed protein product, partial [Amoebophrya sp. A25]|eukprot:GSA25T00000819001.1
MRSSLNNDLRHQKGWAASSSSTASSWSNIQSAVHRQNQPAQPGLRQTRTRFFSTSSNVAPASSGGRKKRGKISPMLPIPRSSRDGRVQVSDLFDGTSLTNATAETLAAKSILTQYGGDVPEHLARYRMDDEEQGESMEGNAPFGVTSGAFGAVNKSQILNTHRNRVPPDWTAGDMELEEAAEQMEDGDGVGGSASSSRPLTPGSTGKVKER